MALAVIRMYRKRSYLRDILFDLAFIRSVRLATRGRSLMFFLHETSRIQWPLLTWGSGTVAFLLAGFLKDQNMFNAILFVPYIKRVNMNCFFHM